jgi:HTH-type transcriptional regulator/antitoxin HipB
VPINPVLAIALQVRWERAKRGLSQGDLAAKVGVSQQSIAKLEDPDGNPTLDTIRRVAEALDVNVTLTLDALSPFAANTRTRASRELGLAKTSKQRKRRLASKLQARAKTKARARSSR